MKKLMIENNLNFKEIKNPFQINVEGTADLIREGVKKIKEESERDAEIVELKHVGERINELMREPWNYTKEQARDIVQTEREKVIKKIHDIQGLEGLGQGIGKALRRR